MFWTWTAAIALAQDDPAPPPPEVPEAPLTDDPQAAMPPGPAAAPAPIAPATGDAALADALLMLNSVDRAREGALLLSTLGDVRAVEALKVATLTRRKDVAVAAAAGMGAFPEATPTLGEILRSRSAPNEVRSAAADALGRIGTPEAADELLTSIASALNGKVRSAAADAVVKHFPDSVPNRGLRSQSGSPWLATGLGWGLGVGLGSAGYYGGQGLEVLGATTGGAAGLVAGFTYGRVKPVDPERAAFVTVTSIQTSAAGAFVGAGIAPEGVWGGALTGELLGAGLGIGTSKLYRGSGRDIGESVPFAWLTAATSAATFDLLDDANIVAASRLDTEWIAGGVGLAGGTAIGLAVAPQLDLSGTDLAAAWIAGSFGATTAVLAADHISDASLPMLGAGVGGLLVLGTANRWEVGADALAAGLGGWALGTGVGTGVGISIESSDDRAPTAAAAVGGAVGLATGVLAAELNPRSIDGGDTTVTALATSWAIWQAGGFASVLEARHEQVGVYVAIPGAIGGAAALASPLIDVSPDMALAGTSIGLWGAYIGASIDILADGDEPILAALIGSDAGLATGAIAVANGVSPFMLALGDAGGVVGAATGGIGAALVGAEDDIPIAVGLAGGVVGFGVGVWAAHSITRPPRVSLGNLDVPGVFALSAAGVRGKLGPTPGAGFTWSGW